MSVRIADGRYRLRLRGGPQFHRHATYNELGPYEILAHVGSGGMGAVYQARDRRLNRIVAVKLLLPHIATRPELLRNFEREARLIASLNHPHICRLYDVEHEDPLKYLVMEYLEGETLAQRLRRGPLPFDQVLVSALQIAAALKEAHGRGIVHRDLKPGNIMLTRWGVKLMDFGLAKDYLGTDDRVFSSGTSGWWAGRARETSGLRRLWTRLTKMIHEFEAGTQTETITAASGIVGTLPYMAPKQLIGKKTDWRTDMFAFGAVLYEMATGRKAFEGSSDSEVIEAILGSYLPLPVSTVQPLATPEFDRIVQTCLAKNHDSRWQDPTQLLAALMWASSGVRERTLKSLLTVFHGQPRGRLVLWKLLNPQSRIRIRLGSSWKAIVFALAFVILVGIYLLYHQSAPYVASHIRPFIGPPCEASFPVRWMFDSGLQVQEYTIYVSEDGRPFRVWIGNTISTEAIYPGRPGHTYGFYSIARAYTGRLEKSKTRAEEITRIGDTVPPIMSASTIPRANANGWNNTNVSIGLTASNDCLQGTRVVLSGAQNIRSLMVPGQAVSVSAEGITTVEYFHFEGAGYRDRTIALTVKIDKRPPLISGMPVAGCTLNRDLTMVRVATITAKDTLAGLAPGSFKVTGRSNEPSDPKHPDIVITANGSEGFDVQLRADRDANGDGRIYNLTATATDLAGNRAVATSTCTVPRVARQQ